MEVWTLPCRKVHVHICEHTQNQGWKRQNHVQWDFWKDRNSSKQRQPFHNGRRKTWRRWEEQKPEAVPRVPAQGQQFLPQNSSQVPAYVPTSLDLTKLVKPSHLAAKLARQNQWWSWTFTWRGIFAVSLQISLSQHPDIFLWCDPISSRCFQSKANGPLPRLQWLQASFSVGRTPPRPIRF